jgi:hypothetical protein
VHYDKDTEFRPQGYGPSFGVWRFESYKRRYPVALLDERLAFLRTVAAIGGWRLC